MVASNAQSTLNFTLPGKHNNLATQHWKHQNAVTYKFHQKSNTNKYKVGTLVIMYTGRGLHMYYVFTCICYVY